MSVIDQKVAKEIVDLQDLQRKTETRLGEMYLKKSKDTIIKQITEFTQSIEKFQKGSLDAIKNFEKSDLESAQRLVIDIIANAKLMVAAADSLFLDAKIPATNFFEAAKSLAIQLGTIKPKAGLKL